MSRKLVLSTAATGQHRKEQHKQDRLTRVALVGALAASLTAAAAFAGTPASAVVPADPDNLMVFFQRDFVSVTGYQNHIGETATVEITRGGVLIGSAQGVVADVGLTGDPAFEINHPGGVCWGNGTGLNVTPDILPGDVASISFAGITAGDTTVQDAYVNAAGALGTTTLAGDTVTVTGHIAPGVIQANTEQRIVEPALVAGGLARTVRAVPGPLTPSPRLGGYRSGLSFNDTDHTFTATYVFDNPALASTAASAGIGADRLMSWEVTDAAGNRQGMTISEFGELGGPGDVGCPNAASDAVTATSPGVVNQAAIAAGGDLTVSGVSFDSSQVSVAAKGSDGVTIATATATPTPVASTTTTPLPGSQTWTTTIPMTAVNLAKEGQLELAITTTRVTAGAPATEAPFAGASKFVLKDTKAPALPSLSPGAGTYVGTQQVTAAGEAGSVLRYGIGLPAVAAPTTPEGGNAVTGQIAITSSQTLNVVAFDAARNASPVKTAAYTINAPAVQAPPPSPAPTPSPSPAPVVAVQAPPTVVVAAPRAPVAPRLRAPAAPRILTAKSGKPGGRVTATASWLAPVTNGGSRVTGYRVIAQRLSAKGKVLATTTSLSIRPAALSAVLRLRAGTYRLRVVAVNAVGMSAMSARSNAVNAR